MPHPRPTPEPPEEGWDFEQVLKQLLRLPPPQTKSLRARARQAGRRAHAKKARPQVSSSA